ncbi:hypothetical protein B0H67DRAFT_640867 [Lasiosphaeris hirsuta]|uniref:Uncharacterized protein n=1 Tax=Lasiosphaeris hirsuta TaxID=260670 RepID=A0AA40AYF7_9PEZI|nr:hypothetical protein B0H67DRAFT_640867 [Lasiosphaeris hirsuta]
MLILTGLEPTPQVGDIENTRPVVSTVERIDKSKALVSKTEKPFLGVCVAPADKTAGRVSTRLYVYFVGSDNNVDVVSSDINDKEGSVAFNTKSVPVATFDVHQGESTLVEVNVTLDGGDSAKGGSRGNFHPNITTTIKYIEDSFTCQGPEKDGGVSRNKSRLKFDAFVVTHWDSDHCQVVLGFLYYKDIRKQASKPNVPPANEIKLRRAIYDEKTGALTSFLYAPSWKTFRADIQKEPRKKKESGPMFPERQWGVDFRTDKDNSPSGKRGRLI